MPDPVQHSRLGKKKENLFIDRKLLRFFDNLVSAWEKELRHYVGNRGISEYMQGRKKE